MSAVLFIMVKRYKNVQHLVKIVFTEIFDLALSIFLDIANVFTCGLSCAYALLEVGSVKYPGKYKVAYAVCICFATAGTIPAIGLRARTMHRLRLHFLDLALKCKDVRVWDESVKQWQAYDWETDMEKRKRNICIVMVLQGLLQDVPFTFINMLLIFYDNSLKEQELLVRPSRCLPSGPSGFSLLQNRRLSRSRIRNVSCTFPCSSPFCFWVRAAPICVRSHSFKNTAAAGR